MKLSSLEYQKNSGKIDLSHLKRKKIEKTKSNDVGYNPDDKGDAFTDKELARLARMVVPSQNLAPVGKGKQLKPLGSEMNMQLHQQSSASIMQSLKTNDQT